MKKIIIPPCVTSRKAFNFGQAVNFIYADVLANYYRTIGESVEFTPYTWNNHAKRTEDLRPDLETYEAFNSFSKELHSYSERMLAKINIIDSDGRYLDSDKIQQEFVKESLDILVDKGFVNVGQEELVLDIPSIIKRTNVIDFLENTIFIPDKYKGMVMYNLKESTPFVLTQKAVYATSPSKTIQKKIGEDKKIKPIFNLYFSPRLNSEIVSSHVVNGSCSFMRYIFDGFLVYAALFNQPLCERVLTYPLINFDPEQGEIENLLGMWNDPNIIRYVALQYVNRNEKSDLDRRYFKSGKKLFTKLKNLDIFFKKNSINFKEGTLLSSVDKYLSVNYLTKALSEFEKETIHLSRRIDDSRKTGRLSGDLESLSNNFFDILKTDRIFFPKLKF